jgi:hypothetical protein
VAAITREGFDCRCSKVGAWGNGTYFADTSCGALTYSISKSKTLAFASSAAGVSFASFAMGGTASSSSAGCSNQHAPQAGTLKLLVARVLLGKQCKGMGGINKPPGGFDSVCDGYTGGYHVIFDNFAAYPEYVITVKQ